MSGDWDYKRALEELWQRSSYERGLITDPFGDVERAERSLRRMQRLLGELGDPHLRVPTVHIAGSKGKGSTGAFITAVAMEAGGQVGFYSSPHLHRFPERIAVGGQPLPDDDFAAVAQTVANASVDLEASAAEPGQVTTFEMITAMAFTAFARRGCDLAVIEVGLGGLYDATNVLAPIVSVITRIDLEHTAILGPTYADIARQKAGIMRQGIPCVSSPQVPDAEAALVRAAAEAGSPLQIGDRDWSWSGSWRSFSAIGLWGSWRDLSLGVPGPHQVENACTALAALYFVDAAGLRIPEIAVRTGLAGARWPGRFERVTAADRDVVFDGAHTPAAATALVETWRQELGPSLATVILGMGADKDARTFLQALRPAIGRLILTRADSPRAADPAVVADAAVALGLPHHVEPSVAAAVDTVMANHPGPLLFTGSLFIVGEGREALGLAAPDDVWRALNEPIETPAIRGPDR